MFVSLLFVVGGPPAARGRGRGRGGPPGGPGGPGMGRGMPPGSPQASTPGANVMYTRFSVLTTF